MDNFPTFNIKYTIDNANIFTEMQSSPNNQYNTKVELATRLFSDGTISVEEASHITGHHPQQLKNYFEAKGIIPKKRILVCGGAGFMGSYFIKYMLKKHPHIWIVNYDKLSYAGNLNNLNETEADERYTFIRGDITDKEHLEKIIQRFKIDYLVNFAAESHVDRSILKATDFIKSNIEGVHILLEVVTQFKIPFIQISTDEVFGEVENGKFTEEHPFRPNNPYSASKAAGDLLCRAYYVTHQTPVIVTHSCNVMGSHQFPEKLIPGFIIRLLNSQKVTVHGDGRNIREWIYVEDHSRAIEFIMKNGLPGRVYNIGTGYEKSNMEITELILDKLGKNRTFVDYVPQRKGNDWRYALDTSCLNEMGWKPVFAFDDSLNYIVNWYANNKWWWEPILSGEHEQKLKKPYHSAYREDGEIA